MKHAFLIAVVALLTAYPASAQAPVLTNADVTHLVSMHVSEQTVISVIQEAAATQFDLSPRALSELAAHLVPTAVIAAMRQPSTRNTAPANERVLPLPPPTAGVQTLAGAAADAAAARRARALSTSPPSTVTLPASAASASPAPKSAAPASPAPKSTPPANAVPASPAPAVPPIDPVRQRQLCVSSLIGDSHLSEGDAIGACKVRSSQEFYICVYQLTMQVDSNTAVNACIKNSSKDFFNCVYQKGKDLGADKRPAVDECLRTIK